MIPQKIPGPKSGVDQATKSSLGEGGIDDGLGREDKPTVYTGVRFPVDFGHGVF